MANTPNIDLDRLIEGQVQGEVTYNEAINKLDSHVHLAIESRILSTPPGSPSNGDRYLIKPTGTGAWAGHDDELAFYYDGWRFNTPKEGYTMWVKNEDEYLLYTGTAWVSLTQNAGMQDPVLDKDLTAPPGSPSQGDRYIVGVGATGAWSGEDNNIAEYDGASWFFKTATDGMTVFITDEDEIYAYQTSAWFQKTGSGGTGSTRYDVVLRRSDYGSDVLAGAALKTELEDASKESIAVEGGTFESTATITQAANQMVDCDPEVVIKLTGSGIHLKVGSECTIHEGTVDGNSSGGGGAAPGLVDLTTRASRLERVRVQNSAGVGISGAAGGATVVGRKQCDTVYSHDHSSDGFSFVHGLAGCYAYNNGGDGFDSCDWMIDVTARDNTGRGFLTCSYVSNAFSHSNDTDGFSSCTEMSNVYADANGQDGFENCTRIENAQSDNNTGYGFNGCLQLSGYVGTGNTSGLFNPGTNTPKSEAQVYTDTADISGGSWSVSTGVLGFIPDWVEVIWRISPDIDNTRAEMSGIGFGRGTAAGDQSGKENHVDESSFLIYYANYDANDIMGFASGGGTAFGESARITQFNENGIVITTQTGQWHTASRTIYVSFIVHGGR